MSLFMLSKALHKAWFKDAAWFKRLGSCVLVAVVLGCSGCAWFKPKELSETPEIDLREDPKEAPRFRPKRESKNHNYGGFSPEANAIERSLGL